MFCTLIGLAVAGCQQLPEANNTSSGADTQVGDAGGSTFLIPTPTTTMGSGDGGPMLDCDPVTQAGCAAGEKCTAVVRNGMQNAYTCVADVESVSPFGPCTPVPETGADGCPAGFVCLADELELGLCVPLCLTDAHCSDAVCLPDPFADVPYCAPTCDPFESLCASPLQCRREFDRFSCKFPRTTDTGVAMAPCSSIDDIGCATGLVCVPGQLVPGCDSSSCCSTLCDLAGPDPCVAPSVCTDLFVAPAPGFSEVGVCLVPA